MADKDLGDITENLEAEMENLQNTKMKIFGITMTPATIMGMVTLLSALLGSLYGGFEVYKDYMEMKEKLANLDTEAIEARNTQIEIKLDEAIEYTRDIKSGLRDDILGIEIVGTIKFAAWYGMIYLLVISSGCLIQIIAYSKVLSIIKKGKSKVVKDLFRFYGNVPKFLILGNIVALISYVLSLIGGIFIILDPTQTPFPPIYSVFDFVLWATILNIGWIVINSLGYILIGTRIINIPRTVSEKS